jgi:hypothetical protein
MKNITSCNNLVQCYNCNKNGFFCTTPCGADYNTCPLCHNRDFINRSYIDDESMYIKYFGDIDNIELDDVFEENSFCDSCRIIFKVGCTHACNGCTDDVYNGHLLGKWKYKGEEYIGMPQFDSIDEWFHEIKNIEMLQWICPNNGILCSKSSYPIKTHPKYYTVCNLPNKPN